MEINPANAEVGQRAQQMAQVCTALVMAGSTDVGGGKPGKIFVIGQTVASLMHTLAMAVGNPGDDSMPIGERAKKALNADSMLYAAFLAVRMGEDIKIEYGEDSFAIEGETTLGPYVFLEAMNDFEKMTGRKPDDKLDPNLVKAARECEAEGNGPAQMLLAKHFSGKAN